MTYQLYKDPFFPDVPVGMVVKDGAFIPLNEDCIGCQHFKVDWKNGATVLDPMGSPLTYSDNALVALGLVPSLDSPT